MRVIPHVQGASHLTFEVGDTKMCLAVCLDKMNTRENQEASATEQGYYNRLAFLFEKVAWATILWAFLVNILSPLNQDVKNLTFLLIFVASVFNFIYFRYGYYLIKKSESRFYLPEIIFPFLIWIFIHLHQEFVAFFLLPYYILILATSLTLKRRDVVIALSSSIFFVFIESIYLKLPIEEIERQLGISQVAALLVFTWVAIKLSDQMIIERGETGSVRQKVLKEEKKSTLLKEFASELVIDRQKAQILIDETPLPILLIDSKSRIVESNTAFKNLSDFKDNSLVGRDMSFILKLATPLHFEGKSFLPENFEGDLLTRRGKKINFNGQAHYLLGRDGRLKQILIILRQVAD